MFTLPPETAYGYYAGTNFLERWGGTELARVAPLHCSGAASDITRICRAWKQRSAVSDRPCCACIAMHSWRASSLRVANKLWSTCFEPGRRHCPSWSTAGWKTAR
jgi:hypothetical protein